MILYSLSACIQGSRVVIHPRVAEQDLERMKEAVPEWCRGSVEVVRVVGKERKK